MIQCCFIAACILGSTTSWDQALLINRENQAYEKCISSWPGFYLSPAALSHPGDHKEIDGAIFDYTYTQTHQHIVSSQKCTFTLIFSLVMSRTWNDWGSDPIEQRTSHLSALWDTFGAFLCIWICPCTRKKDFSFAATALDTWMYRTFYWHVICAILDAWGNVKQYLQPVLLLWCILQRNRIFNKKNLRWGFTLSIRTWLDFKKGLKHNHQPLIKTKEVLMTLY